MTTPANAVSAMKARTTRGFTLIELMIVVAIIGILASIAIPTILRYTRKAKTAEAVQALKQIVDGSRIYMVEERVTTAGVVLAKQFPATEALTPALTCCLSSAAGKCVASQPAFGGSPTWVALKFGLTDAHYYRYEYLSQGTGVGSRFTARALGDLDCDGTLGTFQMTGSYDDASAGASGSGIYSNLEIE
jgi:prepilin-type N-terminal cleavage/methylation domain-containing protein